MERDFMQVGDFLVSDKEIIPRPEQLRKLAIAAMSVAHDAEAFRVPFSKKKVEPVYYWVDAKILNNNSDMTDEFVRVSGMYARRAASIGAHADGFEYVESYDDRWGMRYRELNQIADEQGRWTSGILNEYSFEWDSYSVLKSQGATYEVPSVEGKDIDIARQIVDAMMAEGEIDQAFAYSDTIPATETARGRHFVTRSGCDKLLRELRQRRTRSLDDILAA